MARRQQEKSLQTKNELMGSAMHIFAQKSFGAVTIAEITEHAVYAKGNYRYWKSKDEVDPERWTILSFFGHPSPGFDLFDLYATSCSLPTQVIRIYLGYPRYPRYGFLCYHAWIEQRIC